MSGYRFGASFRLTAGLAIMAVMMIVGSAVAVSSFNSFVERFDRVASSELETMIVAARIGQQSEATIRLLPMLLLADTKWEQMDVALQFDNQIALLGNLIARLGRESDNRDHLDALDAATKGLVDSIDRLKRLATRRLNASEALRREWRDVLGRYWEASERARKRIESSHSQAESDVIGAWMRQMDRAVILSLEAMTEERAAGKPDPWQEAKNTLDSAKRMVGDMLAIAGNDMAEVADFLEKRLFSSDGIVSLYQNSLQARVDSDSLIDQDSFVAAAVTTAVRDLISAIQSDIAQQNRMLKETMSTRGKALKGLAFLCILAALAIGYHIHLSVISRLSHLRLCMHAHVDGNPVAVTTDGSDEIADMARSVEFFITEIGQREAQLRQANEVLDRKVAERTQELTRVNAELRQENEERRRVSEALLESEARLRTIFDTVFDGIITIDSQGIIQTINPAAETIFGHKHDALVGRNISELMPEPHASQHDAYIQRHMETGDQKIIGIGREVIARRSDGRTFPIDLSVARMQIGNRVYFTGLVRDITERKHTERELVAAKEAAEAADRAKSGFLAHMSHELRTPLNAIIGFSEVMKDELLGPIGSPFYRDYATDIHTSGQHLLAIVNDLLDLSRIETGNIQLDEAPLDISAEVAGVTRLLMQQAVQAGVIIQDDIPADLPLLFADRRYFRQIMLNLLSNALKYTPSGGFARVSARLQSDRGLVVAIADTGCGIDAAELERVLHPFQQADPGTADPTRGVGLGLPICKSLMELHHGRLTLQSQIGCGATVELFFPPSRTIHTRPEARNRQSPFILIGSTPSSSGAPKEPSNRQPGNTPSNDAAQIAKGSTDEPSK